MSADHSPWRKPCKKRSRPELSQGGFCAFSPRRIDIGLPGEAEFWNSVSRVFRPLVGFPREVLPRYLRLFVRAPLSTVANCDPLERGLFDKEAVPRRDHILGCC